MNFKTIVFVICILAILFSCTAKSSLTGRYTNESGDKLIVKRNKTYELKEKIDSKTRITKGIWQDWVKDGVQIIQFINIPAYEIETNHTIKVENSNDLYSTITIFYKDTDSIIEIPWSYGFAKNDTIGLMGLHSGYLKSLIFSKTLDSIHLSMWKYKNVTIKTPDTLKHIYTLRFYPTESISYFDRIYNVTGNNLRPVDSTNTDKRLKFKKNGA